jgi:hypothetical protein
MRNGEQRPLKVRLLGGLVVWVWTMYFSVALRTGKGRGREGSGLYPELAELGIQEGKSPALVRELVRLAALLPSYEAVVRELAERGMQVNVKEVHKIVKQAGQAALTYRRRELEAYRAGTLPLGNGEGKRIAVMIDGGRTKIRKTTRRQKGSGANKTQKRRYKAEWREPKLLIVFEMDAEGRMKKGTKPIIDGTFQGPDECMEILAMRLHQMGAAQAEVVAFRSDGAPWMWDRLEWVIQRLGLSKPKVSLGLDWCHAVHHISLALALVLEEKERKRIFKKLRKWLKQGRWQKVVDELTRLGGEANLPAESTFWTDIVYLARHGEAGHMDYAQFRRRQLPVGSGAIESAIRRVINLRMKGNSISWLEENAEAMLLLRGLVISRRWHDEFAKITESMGKDRRIYWPWTSPDMPEELKSAKSIKPPEPQVQSPSPAYNVAA